MVDINNEEYTAKIIFTTNSTKKEFCEIVDNAINKNNLNNISHIHKDESKYVIYVKDSTRIEIIKENGSQNIGYYIKLRIINKNNINVNKSQQILHKYYKLMKSEFPNVTQNKY